MSYTVADVDRVMNDEHEIPYKYGEGSYITDDGLWHLFKYQDVDNLPTELGVISLAAEYGGEGQGDEYWVVVKIVGHDGEERFFRKDGWHASYVGGELDGDTREVVPTPKVVTFYE